MALLMDCPMPQLQSALKRPLSVRLMERGFLCGFWQAMEKFNENLIK